MSERRGSASVAPGHAPDGDHGRLGRRYLAVTIAGLALGGVLGLFLALEAGTPQRHLVTTAQDHVLFTLHGVIMVLLVLLPLVPSVLGNLVIGSQTGASRAAAPWTGTVGFTCHVAGTILVLLALARGGADTGWTFSWPLAVRSDTAVATLALGAALLAMAAWWNALGLAATLLRERTVPWRELPATAWSLWFTSLALLIALPLLGAAFLLVAAGRLGPLALFEAAAGGDPVRHTLLFWPGGHAAVYLMLLPALGVISDVLLERSRGVPRRDLLAGAFGAIALLSLAGWGWHLLGGAVAPEWQVVLSGLSLPVIVPVALVLGLWLEALAAGVRRVDAALVHALWAMAALLAAVAGTLLLASPAAGPLLRGTGFEMALRHELAVGGVLGAFLAGLYQWWPRITGSPAAGGRWGVTGAMLTGLGVQVTFLPRMAAGLAGIPARLHELPPAMVATATWQMVGGGILVAGLALVAHDLLAGDGGEAGQPAGG